MTASEAWEGAMQPSPNHAEGAALVAAIDAEKKPRRSVPTPPKGWALELGRVYRCREYPNELVRVESLPHAPRNPRLVASCSSDDGGVRWISGLRTWKAIQDHYEPTEFTSTEAAFPCRCQGRVMTASNQELAPVAAVEQQTPSVDFPPALGVENSDIDYSVPAIIPEDDALSRLDWHMRMVRKYRSEVAELDDVYLAEMDRMRDRYANRRRIIEDKSRWHQAPIESYHRAHPDQRTIELPHGASKLSVPKTPKVFMNGEHNEAVTEWARRSHPEIMKGPTITDVRKVVDIKDHKDGTFTVVDPTTGEVVPGVTAQIPLPSWSLDVEPGSPF